MHPGPGGHGGRSEKKRSDEGEAEAALLSLIFEPPTNESEGNKAAREEEEGEETECNNAEEVVWSYGNTGIGGSLSSLDMRVEKEGY